MLHDVQEDGTLVWICAHCKDVQRLHVSDERVFTQPRDPHSVALTCPTCAAQGVETTMTIKVAFSDEELTPPTINYDSVGKIVAVQHGPYVTVHRHQVAGRVAHISHWAWHPNLAHHLAAGKHLAAVGKLAPELVRDGLPEPIEIRPGGTTP